MYTKHGHHVPGTSRELPIPSVVARCGGIGLCEQCSVEAAPHLEGEAYGNRPTAQSEKAQEVLDIAYEALIRAVGKSQAHDCIQELQNAGIVFLRRI